MSKPEFSPKQIREILRQVKISREQSKICKRYHADLIRKHYSKTFMRIVTTCAICRWEAYTPRTIKNRNGVANDKH